MSKSIWVNQDARHQLISGAFAANANWRTGTPASSPSGATASGSSITLPVGTYTVDATFTDDVHYGSLSQSSGTTLDIRTDHDVHLADTFFDMGATLSLRSLTTSSSASRSLAADHLVNRGVINASSFTLDLSSADPNDVSLNAGTMTIYGLRAETFDNAGVLTINPFLGSGLTTVGSLFHNEAHATLNVLSTSTMSGRYLNDGTVAVKSGTTTFTGPIDNSAGGTLTGGTWIVGGGLAFSGAASQAIDRLTDTIVTFDKPGTSFTSAGVALQDSLAWVDHSATLRLEEGATFSSTRPVALSGLLDLDEGKYDGTHGGALTALPGSRITGDGVIFGDVTLAGSVTAVLQARSYTPVIVLTAGTADVTGTLAGSQFIFAEEVVHVAASARLTFDQVTFRQSTITMDGTRTLSGFISFLAIDLALAAGSKLVATNLISISSSSIEGEGALTLSAEARSIGTSFIDVALRLDNRMTVYDGTLTVNGAVTGHSRFDISDAATLRFGASVTHASQVWFDGDHAALVLDYPEAFAGTLDLFGAGDSIDLSGFAATSTTFAFKHLNGQAGSLIVFDGSRKDVLHFDNAVIQESAFHLADDGHGGTLITYGSGAAASVQPNRLSADLDLQAMHAIA